MFRYPLSQIANHPFVRAWDGPTSYGHRIVCECTHCGDHWERECSYPAKAPIWVAQYCAKHCHGNEQLRQYWENMYHTSLQRFNMQHRGY